MGHAGAIGGRGAEGDAEAFVFIVIGNRKNASTGLIMDKEFAGGVDFRDGAGLLKGEGHGDSVVGGQEDG